MEEQGAKTFDKPLLLSSDTDFNQSVCGGARREAGQQSGTRQGKRILQGYRVVDDRCGAGHVYEFDAFVSSVQIGFAVPKSTYDISAFEILEQYDIL